MVQTRLGACCCRARGFTEFSSWTVQYGLSVWDDCRKKWGGTVDVGESCGRPDCRALCSDTSSFVPTRIPRLWVFAGGVLRDGTDVLIKRSTGGPLPLPLRLCLRLPREDTASSLLSASQEEGSRQEPNLTAPCSGISSFQSCEKQVSVG